MVENLSMLGVTKEIVIACKHLGAGKGPYEELRELRERWELSSRIQRSGDGAAWRFCYQSDGPDDR